MQIHFLTTDQKIADETANFLKVWDDSSDHVTQKTSGSTGKPKEIKIKKRLMRASAQMTGDFFQLSKKKSALLCISPAYIGGKMMIVRSIEHDLDIFATDISSTPLKNLNHSVDFAAMVPLQVSETLKHHPEKLNLIEYLIIGGAPVSQKLEKALQRVNCKAYSTYGMTETVSHIALKYLHGQDAPFVAIGDTTFSEEDKKLKITCPQLNIDGLRTNDIVDLLNPTSFHWIGRSDFTINTGGVKVQPEEVERKLDVLFPKGRFIIAGYPDEQLGQKVIIIAEQKLKPLIDLQKIKDQLEKYQNPKEVHYVNQIATTSSGKLDRLATLKMIDER